MFNSADLINSYSKIITNNRINTFSTISERERIEKKIIKASNKVFNKIEEVEKEEKNIFSADFFPFLYDDSFDLLKSSIYHERHLLELLKNESERVKSYLNGKVIDTTTASGEDAKSIFSDYLLFCKERKKLKKPAALEKYTSIIMKHLLHRIEGNIASDNPEDVLFFDCLLKMFTLHIDTMKDFTSDSKINTFKEGSSLNLDSNREGY